MHLDCGAVCPGAVTTRDCGALSTELDSAGILRTSVGKSFLIMSSPALSSSSYSIDEHHTNRITPKAKTMVITKPIGSHFFWW